MIEIIIIDTVYYYNLSCIVHILQVHKFNPFVEQQREVQTLLPHSSVLEENATRNGWARRRKTKKQSYEKQLEQHTISVQ